MNDRWWHNYLTELFLKQQIKIQIPDYKITHPLKKLVIL